MTTIVAIRGKNGLIMCADTRATGKTWEYAIKLSAVGDNVVLGFAGTPEYISLLKGFIKNELVRRGKRDYFDTIYDATTAFSEDIYSRNKQSGLPPPFTDKFIDDLCYPEGLVGCYDADDERYRIFKVSPPRPPQEIAFPSRATAGSGGYSADIFLKNTEFILAKIGYWWESLSTALIAQYAFVLMQRVTYVDSHSSGLQAFRLDQSGPKELNAVEVFGPLRMGDHYFRILLETAIEEIGVDRLATLAEDYKFSNIVKKFIPQLFSRGQSQPALATV